MWPMLHSWMIILLDSIEIIVEGYLDLGILQLVAWKDATIEIVIVSRINMVIWTVTLQG